LEDESSYPPANILVVDDHPADLLAISALLDSVGHNVVTASSGQEALRAVASQDFAIILMDAHMPIMDGYETVARLRRDFPTVQTPVVFMSAVYDQPPHVTRGYSLGAIDYLPRPTDPDLLRAKVASFVSLFRRGAELQRRGEVIREQAAAAERARAASRLKDVYLAVICHDLRTPLEVVELIATQLRKGPDAEGARQLADRLERVGRRCQSIVSDLLDFTRGELGEGISINPTRSNLGNVARTVVHEMSLLDPDRTIRLDLSTNLEGEWDVQRAEQAVSNLIQNAVNHGTGPISVEVSGSDDAVSIAIRNGGTIAPDLLQKIFEPFQRGNGKAGGLGLGLYIVREILRAHGGTVNVESSEEKGTTFTSVWPRQPAGRNINRDSRSRQDEE
jgi:signal transduction histidine kinase